MIINHSHRFIFVHVPKSAGTSLTSYFSAFSSYCDIEVGASALGEACQPFYRSRFGLAKHSTAREIRSVVGSAIWGSFLSFAFVRNPYKRAESIFRFFKDTRKSKSLPILAPMDDFESFTDFVLSDYFLTEGMDRILNPQVFWLRREIKADELLVDFVGRVEDINTDLQKIVEAIPILKVKRPPTLEKKNESEHAGADVFRAMEENRRVEERIFSRYEQDFIAFKYPRMGGA